MHIFNNKRAEAITLIFIVVIIALFLGWLINFNSRECRSNSQCKDGFYCGSDFTCHQIPVVEKTIVQNNLLTPSIILGIAIILSAVILKSGKVAFRKTNNGETGEANHEASKNPLKMP